MADGQFIDIRMPRFMVLAIWPVIGQPGPIPDPATGAPYRTPYMDLLDQAIAANQITERDQGKKELLAEWFRQPAGRRRAGVAEPGRCHGDADPAALFAARRCQARLLISLCCLG